MDGEEMVRAYQKYHEAADDCEGAVVVAANLRDQLRSLRAALARAESELAGHRKLQHERECALGAQEDLVAQIDRLGAHAARVEAERDAAEAEVERLKADRDGWHDRYHALALGIGGPPAPAAIVAVTERGTPGYYFCLFGSVDEADAYADAEAPPGEHRETMIVTDWTWHPASSPGEGADGVPARPA